MIHVVTGPPCAGKSTYVRTNAKAGDLRIDYDQLAQALGAEKSHAAEGLIKQAAFDAREGAIAAALKQSDAESWISTRRHLMSISRNTKQPAPSSLISTRATKSAWLARRRMTARSRP